jgi:hypothetical protein
MGLGGALLIAVGMAWCVSGRRETRTDAPLTTPPSAPLASTGPVAPGDPAVVEDSPSVEPSASPAAPTAAAGILVVDALPWGEVTEVVDEAGIRQSLAPSSYTPLVLRLAPGRYTIALKNPESTKPVLLTAVVAAGAMETRVAEFRKVEAEEYFRRAGW